MLAVAQNAFLDISTLGLSGLTGLDANIETKSSSSTRETQQTEAVSWLGGDDLSLVANDSIYARGADLNADEDMLLVSGGDVIWDAAIDQQTSHSYDNSDAGIGTSSEAFTRTSETTVNGVNASAIVFASVKDTEQYSIHSEGSDLLWMKVEGEGRYDETLRQAQIQAAGTLAINAAQGIRIDIKEIDQATVSETIAATVLTGGAGAGVVNAVAGAGAATANTAGVSVSKTG